MRWGPIAALVWFLAAAASAHAQAGSFAIGHDEAAARAEQALTPGEVEVFFYRVGATDRQRAAAGELIGRARGRLAAAAERRDLRQIELGPYPAEEPEGWTAAADVIIREWADEGRAAEAELLAGLRDLLDAEQAEAWGGFERFLRRERQMPDWSGASALNSINLRSVAAGAAISDAGRAAIAPAMEYYTRELDVLLLRRVGAVDALNARLALLGPAEDRAAVMEAFSEGQRRLTVQVARLNRSTFEGLLLSLEHADAERLRAELHERFVPRAAPVGDALALAAEDEGLDPGDRARLRALHGAFEAAWSRQRARAIPLLLRSEDYGSGPDELALRELARVQGASNRAYRAAVVGLREVVGLERANELVAEAERRGERPRPLDR